MMTHKSITLTEKNGQGDAFPFATHLILFMRSFDVQLQYIPCAFKQFTPHRSRF